MKRSSGKVVEELLHEYGTHVAEDRALSDMLDGLKPVQRRLLWTMWNRLHLKPNSTPKRSARVVGETIGVFHPHGDSGSYGALVNMAHTRYPLIRADGNFGSPVAGLGPAAQRYTGVSAADILPQMFEDEAVANLVPNYSGEFVEPERLPSRLPLLLMNGSEGIAVGVTSNIPPHNLTALVKVLLLVLKNPDRKVKALTKILGGPSYPDGGNLLSEFEEVVNLYKTGKGTLTFQCQHTLKKDQKGIYTLTVTGGSPNWRIPHFMEVAQRLRDSNEITSVVNESGDAVKVVVTSRDRDSLVWLVQKGLTTRISYNWIALDAAKKPVRFNLLGYCEQWLNFRLKVAESHLRFTVKRLARLLMKEEAKLAAVRNIDVTIKAIRQPKPIAALKKALGLKKNFQAKVILATQLRALTKKGVANQEKTVKGLQERLAENRHKLANVPAVVEAELKDLLRWESK